MISVYLQPKITQIVRGKLSKDQNLDVQYAGQFASSYLSTVDQFLDSSISEAAAVNELARFFYDIKEMASLTKYICFTCSICCLSI